MLIMVLKKAIKTLYERVSAEIHLETLTIHIPRNVHIIILLKRLFIFQNVCSIFHS